MTDTINKETNEIGEIRISSEVVSVIACNVASEVEGVSYMSGGIAGNISQVLGRKNLTKGVKVEITEKNVVIDLYIVVDYGARIPEVSWKIQDRVKSDVEQMTGLDVTEINIHVQGVSFEKESVESEKNKQETESVDE